MYIYRERETERERDMYTCKFYTALDIYTYLYVYVYVYIYVYMYTYMSNLCLRRHARVRAVTPSLVTIISMIIGLFYGLIRFLRHHLSDTAN